MGEQIDKSLSFILSTGRTGTQFFSKYLSETCDDLICWHEPKPSRRFKWYSNFYLSKKLSGEFIARQYIRTRRSVLFKDSCNHYVESNNFIFGCMEPISTTASHLAVLHIIRDPFSYVRSHLNKGFWKGIKKFTAKNVPGWLENIDPAIKSSNDPVMILLARWIYVNRIIYNYQDQLKYMSARFEDVFDASNISSFGKLNEIREFLGYDALPDAINRQWLSRPSNISKTALADDWPVLQKHNEYLAQNGYDLLEHFNYSIEEQK
jgi:hypothetical protein